MSLTAMTEVLSWCLKICVGNLTREFTVNVDSLVAKRNLDRYIAFHSLIIFGVAAYLEV